ncbi:MAG: hypothetical protein ACXADX_15240, partial [Candidatus Hodarchaeales archaeon]
MRVLANNAEKDKNEVARFLFTGDILTEEDDELDVWVVKHHQRSMMETTAKLEEFPTVPVR